MFLLECVYVCVRAWVYRACLSLACVRECVRGYVSECMHVCVPTCVCVYVHVSV